MNDQTETYDIPETESPEIGEPAPEESATPEGTDREDLGGAESGPDADIGAETAVESEEGSNHEETDEETPQTAPSLSEDLLDGVSSAEGVPDVLPIVGDETAVPSDELEIILRTVTDTQQDIARLRDEVAALRKDQSAMAESADIYRDTIEEILTETGEYVEYYVTECMPEIINVFTLIFIFLLLSWTASRIGVTVRRFTAFGRRDD